MLDTIKNEKRLSLAEAARLIPPTRLDRPVAVSTLIRWVTQGVQGVRLEAFRLGWRWVTTEEAIDRFMETLTAQRLGENAVADPAGKSHATTRAARRKQQEDERVER